MIPAWFLYLQGFAMLFMGVAMLATRPREKGATFAQAWFSPTKVFGTIWALLCMVAGIALLAMALGYWQPFPRVDPAPASRSRRY